MAERIYLPAKVSNEALLVVGLFYRSDELTALLRDMPPDARAAIVAAVDPDDLREVVAQVGGHALRVSAVDRQRAGRLFLAVQLCLADPPSVRIVGPSRSRRLGARSRPHPERPWLRTVEEPRS